LEDDFSIVGIIAPKSETTNTMKTAAICMDTSYSSRSMVHDAPSRLSLSE
jgi:hypothetical protein